MKLLLPIALAALTSAGAVNAATVNGGSDLLTGSSASKLETWLTGDVRLSYSGALTFMNIFDKSVGDTSAEFHKAVDGEGATITVMEATDSRDPDTTYLIGGFNPQSWSSDSAYNYSASITDRTAFLFNLTTDQRLFQETVNRVGSRQTFNHADYGPTFGLGHDLYVDMTLNQGYAAAHGYCYDPSVDCVYWSSSADPLVKKNILGLVGDRTLTLTFGAIEVFSISASPLRAASTFSAGAIAPVPVPAGLPLLVAALAGLVSLRRRRT